MDASLNSGPLIIPLAVTVWAAVLSMMALLIGSLSDDRNRKVKELQESHLTETLSDPLTGVANRRAFEYELQRRLIEWRRQHTPLALVMIDVDHFKRFNDVHGHQAGDEVLRGVARALDETTRAMDLVARYGGEEFGIIMPNTNVIDVKDAAERARADVAAARVLFGESELGATVSVGVAIAIPSDDANSLVKRADKALYASKQAGRNCAHLNYGEQHEHFGGNLRNVSEPSQQSQEPSVESTVATVDSYDVTGLPSRTVFGEDLRGRVAEVRRYHNPVSVMLVEINDFSRIVKSQGPCAGSLVVEMTAKFIASALRGADLVSRFTKSQFAVLIPATPISDTHVVADRLHHGIATCERTCNSPICFTVSIGVAEVGPDDDATSVLRRAEAALMEATTTRDPRTCFHNGQSCGPTYEQPDSVELDDPNIAKIV